MKLVLITSLFTSLLVIATAAEAKTHNILQNISACKSIKQDEARLACFDAIELPGPKPMPERMDKTIPQIVKEKQQAEETVAPVAPRPPAAQPKVKEQEKAEEQAEFGLVQKRTGEELQKVTEVVSHLSETARGKRNIHLTSGAIWQQTDRGYIKLKPGMEVYIEKGALGSFYLSYEGINRRVKVKRVK